MTDLGNMNLGNSGIEEWNFTNKKGKMNSPAQVVDGKTETDRNDAKTKASAV